MVGLGNPILSDDSAGICVAREITGKISRPDLVVVEASLGGLKLLDILEGYDTAIIIDATQTSQGKPGQIHKLESSALAETRHINSTHDLSLVDALEFGKKLGIPVPHKITIYAIEAEDVSTFSESCTPRVKRAISRCAEMVIKELDKISY